MGGNREKDRRQKMRLSHRKGRTPWLEEHTRPEEEEASLSWVLGTEPRASTFE